jgi:hypothetical protein
MRAVALRELANRLRAEREDAESRQDARQSPEDVSVLTPKLVAAPSTPLAQR